MRFTIIRMLALKHKALILEEGRQIKDFMQLLMKQRNTKVKLTKEEIRQLKVHLRHLSLSIPALAVFVLPFGSLLLPLLAELLDRRKRRRGV